jgi:hypothetical protein
MVLVEKQRKYRAFAHVLGLTDPTRKLEGFQVGIAKNFCQM